PLLPFATPVRSVFTASARALRKEPIGAPIRGHDSRGSHGDDEVWIAGRVGAQAQGVAATAEIAVRDQPSAFADGVAGEGWIALKQRIIKECLGIGGGSAAVHGDGSKPETPGGIDVEPAGI